jgi:hypothetical protein
MRKEAHQIIRDNIRFFHLYLHAPLARLKTLKNTPTLSFPPCIRYGVNSGGNPEGLERTGSLRLSRTLIRDSQERRFAEFQE